MGLSTNCMVDMWPRYDYHHGAYVWSPLVDTAISVIKLTAILLSRPKNHHCQAEVG